MRALLITNPNSTGQRPEVMRQVLAHLLPLPGLRLKSVFTHYPQHAVELCAGLTRADYDVVIGVGGDGTLNEIINGLLGGDAAGSEGAADDTDPTQIAEAEPGAPAPEPAELPALALLPTGSANVFARALGFPQDPVAAAELLARLLREDLRRTIHLARWNGNWFGVNAGFGIDADVIARMERARSRGFAATPLLYLTTSLLAWNRIRRDPPQISVRATSVDGGEMELDDLPLLFASNTNPWTFLGPLPVVTNPANSFDRGLGLFGLTHLDGVGGVAGMLHLLGMGHSRWFERFIEKRTVRVDDAADLTLRSVRPRNFQVDGELAGEFDEIRLHTVPDAIEVFAPREETRFSDRPLRQVLRDFLRWH